MSHERVEINPNVMQGKPVIRGTRIPVELLLRKLGEGAAVEDLLDAYPGWKPTMFEQRWLMRQRRLPMRLYSH
jgi:uncharacterized protein (DUF433 family)